MQPAESELGGRIDTVLRIGVEVGHAANRDDQPPSRPLHGGKESPGHGEWPHQIHLKLTGQLRHGSLLEGDSVEHPRIIDEDIRSPRLGKHPCPKLFYRCRIGEVGGEILEGPVSAVFERPGHPHHPGPGFRQRGGNGETDAAGGTGHQSKLAFEWAHTWVRPSTSLRNSSRVRGSLRKLPRTALVTVREFCFSTPRIAIQR